jgi:UDP-N-acetylmuramoylalanine--D-glutamate ligase
MSTTRPRKATIFEFVGYTFEPGKGVLSLSYRMHFEKHEPMNFLEKVRFPVAGRGKNIPNELLTQTLELVHLTLGVSYYKLFVPPKVLLHSKLSAEQAHFFTTLYRRGLGEFYYRNKLDPKRSPVFPSSKSVRPVSIDRVIRDRALVGIGGGKDSIVSLELLKEQKLPQTAFVVETGRSSSIVDQVIKLSGLGTLRIHRTLDSKVLKPIEGSFNGHIPISSIFAALGMLAAVLFDYRYVIVGNEYSSSVENLRYRGEVINHQWSKSREFEELFQAYSRNFVTRGVTYFSLLRPFYEIRITELFTRYPKYFSVFSSCNRNFKITTRQDCLWCGECPKCVFMYTMLAAFLKRQELLQIFGRNLFAQPELLSSFGDILGFGTMKPFDCVGTFEEAQAALYLASKKFKNDLAITKYLSRIKNPKKLVEQTFSFVPSSTVPAHFRFSALSNTLLLGYAREGHVTKRYLEKHFTRLKIGIADASQSRTYLQKQKDFEFAVKTPGLPKKLVTIPYTTATNIFFSRNQNKVIGVTGTKGKSTTASLIYALLRAGGLPVQLVGNIGKPMLELLSHKLSKDTLLVVELSSYQLDDAEFSPHVAVITSLFPEHMTYHGSLAAYYEAKKNIFLNQGPQDALVLNPRDVQVKRWAALAPAKKIPFAASVPLKRKDIPLIGEHNLQNVRAAIAVAKHFGVSNAAIAKGLRNFKPLPHRLELVGSYRGITFYDDAISTTPESTIQAIESLKKVDTIFLGGEDRGYNFRDLRTALQRHAVRNVVLFPETGSRILTNKKKFNILSTRSMREAVAFAYKHTKAGRICLLSTASPSYTLWKDFEHKGREFQRFVRSLGRA